MFAARQRCTQMPTPHMNEGNLWFSFKGNSSNEVFPQPYIALRISNPTSAERPRPKKVCCSWSDSSSFSHSVLNAFELRPEYWICNYRPQNSIEGRELIDRVDEKQELYSHFESSRISPHVYREFLLKFPLKPP